MNELPHNIRQFIHENKAVSIACHDQTGIWAASCFYVLCETTVTLVILSSCNTQHGNMMLANPHIAGTIAVQPDSIRDIRGLQFTAHAELLNTNDPRRPTFHTAYTHRHPAAKLMDSDLWLLHLERIKYTDNQLVFARKTHWQRD